MATVTYADGRKTVAVDPYLNQLRGDKVTASVQAPNPASLVDYQVGDRLWAMHAADASLRSLVEVVRVGRKRVSRGKGVYDEDDVHEPRPMTGVSGYAGGWVETHEHEYTVRVLHTEPMTGYEGFHPERTAASIYPSLGL